MMELVNLSGRRLALRHMQVRDLLYTKLRDDRGEGVISMAIAVLIIAFLGVALWLAFKGLVDDTEAEIGNQIGEIGKD